MLPDATIGSCSIVHCQIEITSVAGSGVALFAAACFLPFLVGMDEQLILYLVVASFSGFTGVMILPIHICFVLTYNVFGADFARTWRRLVAPYCGFAATGGIFLYLLQTF